MRTSHILTTTLLLVIAPTLILASVPHVDNGAEPRDGIFDYTLDVQWRAGGLDDDENLFGVIMQALADEDGNLYLLDNQLSQVTVFSPDGERIATLSREGDGPGESRRPNDMLFLPEDKIGLMQVFPGKIVQIDRQGNPAGTFPLNAGEAGTGSFSVLVRGKCASGNIVLVGIDQAFAQGMLDQTYYMRSYTAAGAVVAEYTAKTAQQSFANMVLDEVAVDFVWTRFDVADDGTVVLAPARNDYTVQVFQADGTLIRTFGRAYESLPRDEADSARAQALLEAQGRNYPVMPQITITDIEPDINGIRAFADGVVWVQTSRGTRDLDDGVMMIYDVFDAEGVFTHQARIMTEGDGEEDLLYLIDDERAVLIHNFRNTLLSSMGVESDDDEAEPMEVVYCRIVR